MRIVTLFLFGLYLLHSVFLFCSISKEGKKERKTRALGFGPGNAIDDDCFYFISWLSKGLIIYQWRMQGMKFGGAGCDIYIH